MRLVDGGDPAWPIAAYRAAIWLCFALGLFASHHALRALGAAPLPALCGSLAWTFAPVFRSRALETHLVTAAFLVPAVTLALVRLIDRPSRGRALILGATAGACVCFSEYYTPFLWLGLVLLLATSFLWRDTREGLRVTVRELGWRGTTLLAVGFLLAAGPFLLNWSPASTLRFREGQAYFESTNLAGLAIPDPAVSPLYSSTPLARWNARVRRGVGGAQVFLGLPVLLLALGGATRLRTPRHRLLLVLATAFLLLSLGPELKVFGTNTRILLPYRALMLVPPFDLARAPARLSALGLWGLVGLMALCLTRIEARLGEKKGTVVVLLVAAWCLAEADLRGSDRRPLRAAPRASHPRPGRGRERSPLGPRQLRHAPSGVPWPSDRDRLSLPHHRSSVAACRTPRRSSSGGPGTVRRGGPSPGHRQRDRLSRRAR